MAAAGAAIGPNELPAAYYTAGQHGLFLDLGLTIAGFRTTGSDKTKLRRFRSNFGTRPEACAQLWHDIKTITPNLKARAHPRHLFWALMFAKQYPTEHQLAGRLRKDEKTVRLWVWYIGKRLRALKPLKVSDDCRDTAGGWPTVFVLLNA